VYTVFHETSARREYPMRCIQNRRMGYIFNGWSDGETVFRNESQSGRTFRAMLEAAKKDEKIAARVRLFQYRVPEELYAFGTDPHALKNLIDDPGRKAEIARMQRAMLEVMQAVQDPLLDTFQQHLRESKKG
jgi:N-sulfoglucosamine sulfohydrolase